MPVLRLPTALVSAALIAAALAYLGYSIGAGLQRIRTGDRYVSVKGLAEREVAADLVVWPLTFQATGDDLPSVDAQVRSQASAIAAFLAARGLADAEQGLSTPRIQDFAAEGMRGPDRPPHRYRAEVTYTVRSGQVDAVRAAMQASSELVRAGVALAPWGPPPEFSYTRLNDTKPELLAEATRAARSAAEQFAKDSSSRVGRIRTANQGQITISDRDAGTPHVKRVRVVSTVEYELLDP